MTYLQTPPDALPSVLQATTGLQNWKCAARHLVQIGGRLPTANQLHQPFTFVEVTLVQYATVAGRFPGAAAAAKAKPRKVSKAEVTVEEQPIEEPQACAVTPSAKSKGPSRGSPAASPPKADHKPPEARKEEKAKE